MKSTSNIKPNDYTFERYPRGGYILWLRENFREVTSTDEQDEAVTSWVYDEYTILIPTYLSNSFIEQHFNEYLTEARKKEASDNENRISAVEDAVYELAQLIGGASND